MPRWVRIILTLAAVVLVSLGLMFESLANGLCEKPGCSEGITDTTIQLVLAGVVAGALACWPRRRR